MSYIAYKHLHTSFAVLSIVFFIIRAYWSVLERSCLHNRFVRIAAHVLDTLLLLSGLGMAFMLGFTHFWLIAKIIGLLCYIYAGVYAVRLGRTPHSRLFAAIVAILIYCYVVGVAITKSAWSFFG